MKYKLLIIITVFSCTFGSLYAKEKRKLQIVTSFSILENIVNELGGNHVTVTNLVGCNKDAHIYQPKPADSIAIANADLVVINGLGFEGWIARLLQSSANDNKRVVIASSGIQELITDGELDPHAWQSLENIQIYANNITQALIKSMPEYESQFILHNQEFITKIKLLKNSLQQKINLIPKEKRLVITNHDAFGYLGREFSIKFISPMGISTYAEPTARGIAQLIDQIKLQGVKVLFIENINPSKLLNQISKEVNVTIGGSLYSDALSEAQSPAATYANMMQHNVELIIDSLKNL